MQDLSKQTVNRYPVYEQQYTVIFLLFLLREIFIAHTDRKHYVYINSSVYYLFMCVCNHINWHKTHCGEMGILYFFSNKNIIFYDHSVSTDVIFYDPSGNYFLL